MFYRALRLAGFDLEAKIRELEWRVANLKNRAVAEGRAEASYYAFKAGMYAAAAFLLFLALVAAIVAIAQWLAPMTGLAGAWAIVAAGLAVIAGIIVLIASAASRKPAKVKELPPPVPAREARVYASTASGDDGKLWRFPMSALLASMVPRLSGGIGAPIADSTAAVNDAADLMKRGSRTTVFSILVAAAVVGFIAGHRGTGRI